MYRNSCLKLYSVANRIAISAPLLSLLLRCVGVVNVHGDLQQHVHYALLVAVVLGPAREAEASQDDD